MRNIKSEIIAALFILLFAYTAIQKYGDHAAFLLAIQSSPLLHGMANFVSWSIPVAELGIVCLLLFPSLRRTGLICAALLLALFTFYIGYMLVFTPNLPCTCGGVISYLSWKQHLIFNMIFLALALYGWLTMKPDKNIIIRISRTPVI